MEQPPNRTSPSHRRKETTEPGLPLTLLHLEDDPQDVQRVRETLESNWPDCRIEVAIDGNSFKGKLTEQKFDLILSDYHVPGFNGLAALAASQQLCPHTPFLIFSCNTGEEIAVEALKAGLQVIKVGTEHLGT